MKCKHAFPMEVDGELFEDFCRYDADGDALCPKCGKPAKKIVASLQSECARLRGVNKKLSVKLK